MTAAQGPAIGMAVTTFFGTIWWLAALRFSRMSPARLTLVGIGFIALTSAIVHYYHAHAKAPSPAGPPPEWTTFSIVANAEWIVILIAATVLRRSGQADWIVTMVATVVGLHFIPLATVFNTPLYDFAAAGLILGAAAGLLGKNPRQRQALTCAIAASTLWSCGLLIYALQW